MNFLDIHRPDEHGKCPEGYRVCGDTSSAGFRQTCIESGSKCPITDTIVADVNSDLVKNSTYEQYPLGGNKVLLVSRETNHFPVVQFKLTEGSPCIDEKEYDFTKNKYFYKLLDRSYYKGCQTVLNGRIVFDERYRLVGSESEVELYQRNGVYDAIEGSPLRFGKSFSKDYQWNLYQRSYIDWSTHCEKDGPTRQGKYTYFD